MTMPEEDEFTELVDATFPRVDLVGKGANGIPRFLIAKQDGESAGLLEPEFVRSLIAKSEPGAGDSRERVEMPNGITINGSAGAIAELIHKAALGARDDAPAAYYEAVAKAKYNAADLKRMAADGQAMADESYPIGDEDDLGKAVRAVGRGGADHDAIRRHVVKRAKALGKSSEIPDNWNSDGSLKGDVSKEAGVPETVAKDLMDAAGDAMPLDDGIDGLDPTVPLAMPEEMAPGDPTDPGSPAWESIDAATAQKWTSILARAGAAISLMSDREALEAASADPSDIENAMDLQDVCCAIDYAISVLAPFAVSEQSEADCGAMGLEAIGKAALALEASPLAALEGLTAVRKAGRVLSSANEAKIRDAAKALGDVLASLPSAPAAETVAKEKGAVMPVTTAAPAAPVAKADAGEQARDAGPVSAGGTTGMGEPRATGPADALPADGPQAGLPGDVPGRTVVKSALALVYDQGRRLVGVTDSAAILTQVAKADGDGEKKAMQAVFDQDGDLIGIVDPDAIQPVTGAGGSTAAAPGPAAAADPADMTPQPPADAGTPADAVGKAAQDVTTGLPADLDSIIAKAVAAALSASAPAQDVAKSADVAGAIAEVELLKARLAKVEETPAAPGVFTNGAVPPEGARPLPGQGQLRGQDAGAQPVSVAKAAELKQELYTGSPARQVQVAGELTRAAVAELTAIHAGARR